MGQKNAVGMRGLMNDLPIIKSKAESKTTQVIGNLTGTEVSSGVNSRRTDTVSDRLKQDAVLTHVQS